MRDLLFLTIHLLVTCAKLLRPGGVRAVAAGSLLLKHQIMISHRSRQRAPNLTTLDRFVLALTTLYQLFDFVGGFRASRSAHGTAIVFFRDQSPIPSKQGIGCDHGVYLKEPLAADQLRFGCEAPSLTISEQWPLSTELLTEYAIFFL